MQIKTVGVAGLGFLGRGVAACLLAHGFRVVGYTRQTSTRKEARQHIEAAIRELVTRGGFPQKLLIDWQRHYFEVTSLAGFSQCNFIIESVAEDLTVKQQVFDEIEKVADPNVPIASNTSALPITLLQRNRKYPGRFVGMHWAEPPHATRFMELIRGELTSNLAFELAISLAKAVGKEPSLVHKDVPAFIVNRLAYAMYREALNLLETGVGDAETIDRSFRNAVGLWAMLVGPFRWIDLSGGPVLYAKAMEGVLPTLSNVTAVPKTIWDLAESGARGIANRRGFFQYTDQEAEHWEELYRRHTWKVRELMNEYFPLEES